MKRYEVIFVNGGQCRKCRVSAESFRMACDKVEALYPSAVILEVATVGGGAR